MPSLNDCKFYKAKVHAVLYATIAVGVLACFLPAFITLVGGILGTPLASLTIGKILLLVICVLFLVIFVTVTTFFWYVFFGHLIIRRRLETFLLETGYVKEEVEALISHL